MVRGIGNLGKINPTDLERKHPSYDRSPWTCFNTSIKENIDLRNLIQKWRLSPISLKFIDRRINLFRFFRTFNSSNSDIHNIMLNNFSLSEQDRSQSFQNIRSSFFGSEIRFHDDLFREILDFEGSFDFSLTNRIVFVNKNTKPDHIFKNNSKLT
ncbi:hypothetical protein LEP1GSC103_3056 [Leptospira borgpetersenii serovar Javanica str. UI 09931]|uniref:Uncharacterized protein n=1 Tax=Leptospira borgpetersenii serovar Javanica str. UI 09931 TaxID=1049767 RepID=A0AAV3J9Y2_LEPBO|nr:hypothetical protein [Leptospira borgpetersenii]AXX14608.1 hypothetical protein C4Q31_02555 [Leptospira borgpetersenii serovar Ceylonica]EMK10302.1 hypothetical protein LEP1GSC066_3418 [Leptospira sp. serovar Kenya str. Sh9]EMN56861.1 hypothetical protein LEP1GSC090_1194 [Leptospira borgpetersenii serovar Javanica str. MK146]EKQ91967.1 hypothetical protein LEP1GSC101_3395 [Leptospira borgpetersenii str. UI 09149]EPG57442.1 hypothetical protein LEP1GSC103_3056 [Leptospira borgpetersenii sero